MYTERRIPAAEDRFSTTDMDAHRLSWNLRTDTLTETNRHESPTLSDYVADLYESQREDVFRYLRSRGLDASDAREICQESFFRLFVALRRGEKIQNPRAWVFTVAHNQGVNRSLASAAEVLGQEPDLDAIAPHLDPEQRMIERERLKRLQTAVGSLPAQQRSFLNLRAAGFRYREIADITGVTISTVGESLRRAVTRLRKALYE